MNPNELAYGIFLVAGIVAFALFIGWRQAATLRGLGRRPPGGLEKAYLRRRAIRRLACSVLMLAFAGMLIGSYFMEGEFQRVTAAARRLTEAGERPRLEGGDRAFLRGFTIYWSVALVLLLSIMALAVIDFVATLRYGFRQHQQLQRDYHAALERQLDEYQSRRNGEPRG